MCTIQQHKNMVEKTDWDKQSGNFFKTFYSKTFLILQTGKKDKFVFLKDPYLFLKEQGLSAHEDNTDGSTRIYVQPHATVYVALRERS